MGAAQQALLSQKIAGGGGGSTPTFVAPSAEFPTATFEDQPNFSLAQGALTQGYIVVAVSWWSGSGRTLTGGTYDGVAMSILGQATGTTDTNLHIGLLGLAVGTKGAATYNIVVTMSGTCDEICAGAMAFSGVHQTVSTGAFVNAGGDSTTPSVAVASVSGDLVVDSVAFYEGNTATPGTDQTTRWDVLTASNTQDGAGSTEVATGVSTTMSWTVTTGDWAICGVALKQP